MLEMVAQPLEKVRVQVLEFDWMVMVKYLAGGMGRQKVTHMEETVPLET